jgi:hypothetical protein
MSGRNITDLPKPLKRYRPSKAKLKDRRKRLEKKLRTIAEARTRSDLLTTGTQIPLEWKGPAKRLARRINPDTPGHEPPSSPASPVYMRKQRSRIGGAMWKLIRTGKWGRVSTFTLIGRGWAFAAGSLSDADAIKLLASVRSDLNRCGAKVADGWLILGIHGEYDPGTGMYQLHVHGVAADGMIGVVDRLRDRPKYRSKRTGPDKIQRVRISEQPLTDLPSPLTYVVQSFWPCRWSGEVGEDRFARQRRKGRIPEPQHTEVLLWLDRWSLADLILIMKLRVTKGGLKPIK